jgi:ELWxxDGT repeat protein
LLFSADDNTNGSELWVTDGTPNGTTMLKDIRTGSEGSSPGNFTAFGSQLLFSADDGTNGSELWVTDGTVHNTVMLKDIRTGSGGSFPGNFTAFGSQLLFSADDGTNGDELWVTDGTPNGTTMLKDIRTGSGGSFPGNFTAFGSQLLFSAHDNTNGSELWVTDGTPNGTTMLKDIRTGSEGSSPGNFTAFGSQLLFSADDGTNGSELWVTDGTVHNTVMLKDIYQGSNGSSPTYMKVIGNTAYFFASDAVAGREPWKTDGTLSGTTRIADVRIGVNSSCYMSNCDPGFVSYGTAIVFVADDGINGAEPYITDGTTLGTVLLADLRPGSNGSFCNTMMCSYSSDNAARFVNVGGRFLFAADNGQLGAEIWTLTARPGAPTTVSAAPSTNSAVVSWVAPSSVLSPITSYTVTSNPGALTCTTSALSCTVTGLLSNQDYTFTVTATSGFGTSLPSVISQRVRTLSPRLGSLLASMTAVTDIVSDTTLAPGESVTTLYTGFNPNELVLMLMASNPVVIGSANADANGNVAITGNIPANASAGSHTLALYAPVSGFGAKQPITITANGSSSGSGSGIQSPNVDPNTLPATGRGVDLTLWAYLMLIIGLGIVASRRIMAPFVGNHPRRTR